MYTGTRLTTAIHRRLLSRFFLMEGGRLYTGYGESTRLPPVCPGFKSRRRCHMWVEFVVGSFLCSERFFSGYSGFPLSSKTNISKFQFDQESGRRRTTMWTCYLQIVIYLFILYRETQKGRSSSWTQARRKYRCYWRWRIKRYVDCCTLKLYLMANTSWLNAIYTTSPQCLAAMFYLIASQ